MPPSEHLRECPRCGRKLSARDRKRGHGFVAGFRFRRPDGRENEVRTNWDCNVDGQPSDETLRAGVAKLHAYVSDPKRNDDSQVVEARIFSCAGRQYASYVANPAELPVLTA